VAYKILHGLDFAVNLLETNDLDPVYVMLWEAEFDNKQLTQWLVAYWCLYHVGAASVLSESEDFWNDLARACRGTNFPRGVERRHFRGDIATESVKFLRREAGKQAERNDFGIRGSTEDLVDSLYSKNVIRLPDMITKVSQWNGFGPWISFKVADMLERLNLQKINSYPKDVFLMFDAPRMGAQMLFEREYKGKLHKSIKPEEWAYDYLTALLSDYYAPPTYNRIINIQEIETILCKYKSHCNGKYPLGHDLIEVRQSLVQFARCKTNQRLLKSGKAGGLW
jgi:hypothetical protein